MLLRATLLALACSLAVATAPAVVHAQTRPIAEGTYELSIAYGGGLIDATLEIGYRGDSITAVLRLGDHDSPVRAGKRTGTKLVLEPTSPAVDVRYDLEFTGDDVKGTFTFQGQAGTLTGKRRRSGQ